MRPVDLNYRRELTMLESTENVATMECTTCGLTISVERLTMRVISENEVHPTCCMCMRELEEAEAPLGV